MAEICIGCGLTVDPVTGRLIANTDAWPGGAPVGLHTGDVYCDPVTGRLHTRDITESGSTSFYPVDTAVPVGWPLITKASRWAGTADGAGVISIVFPAPFPHGIISAAFTYEPNNTLTPEAPWFVTPMRNLSNASQLTGILKDGAGSNVTGARRLLYTVIGW